MRNKKKSKIFICLILMGLFAIYIIVYIDNNIKPTIIAISEIEAKSVATQAINESVKKKIKNDINYNDLIFVRYNSEGKVTLMQANTILMNNIASDVAIEVREQMEKISQSKIEIPLSNAFDIQLIMLPKLKLKVIPQGSVTVDFATEFEESGINQTRHRIYLIIETDIKIIVPLVSEDIKVTTNIPIAETIIIGDVPQHFIKVPKEEALDIIN